MTWRLTSYDLAAIEAFSTAMAALFAIVAASLAYKAVRREGRIEQRLRDDAVRDQASLISGWTESDEWISSVRGSNKVSLNNASQVPVYNVQGHLYLDGDEIERLLIVEVLRPGSTKVDVHTIAADLMSLGRTRFDTGTVIAGLRVVLEFTDAAGRHWIRDDGGVLRQLSGR